MIPKNRDLGYCSQKLPLCAGGTAQANTTAISTAVASVVASALSAALAVIKGAPPVTSPAGIIAAALAPTG